MSNVIGWAIIALFVWAECLDCVGLRPLVRGVRRAWYWRHHLVTVHVQRYIGGARGEFWCTHCGGSARAEAVTSGLLGGPWARVTEATCPSARARMVHR